MSASSEYEPAARQDYGPATSSDNVFGSILENKLADKMSVSSVRTPVLRAVPLSPSHGETEPDSTNTESIIQSIQGKVDKEVEYHFNDKRCDTEMAYDSLSSIVRIEETNLDHVGRIAYPIIQEADDMSDGSYVENSGTTLIQAPLNTAIVQNVSKLPQNFTINVDATMSNITAIQNVSQDVSGNQTVWLPTIIATSAPTQDIKHEEVSPSPGVSQIIITSESYVKDANDVGRRSNIVTETGYLSRPKTSKVQILSNISIPKNPGYSQQYITQGKEIGTSLYGTQNHVYKLTTNMMSQKHLSNSVLCTKPPKNQSLIGCSSLTQTVVNNSPVKNVSYSHTFAKGTNLNKMLSKVNNGANLNAMVASSGSTQCHILSRVVSGPNKVSVHSGRKSASTLKGSKSSSQASGGHKSQSRSIKIIQQAGTVHKSESKPWPVASVTYKTQQPTYGVIDSNTSKIIQKIGSPTNKSQSIPFQKLPSKGERLILQSPCGPVLISTAPISTSLPKGPHYVQSGSTPNLRYVHTYGSTEQQISNISQVATNQHLTAQILQSLSQPKLMLQTDLNTVNQSLQPLSIDEPIEESETKPVNQKRIVFGDKSTLLTANDIVGMEERPNLTEELRRYSFQALAFVMLDHTYALPAQKQPSPTPTTPVSTIPPTIVSPTLTSSPMSPIKTTSPVIMPTSSYEMPLTVPTSVIGTPIPVSSIQMGCLAYKPQPLPAQDDDAASNISSLDGERRQGDRGSDTETAPEGEEEGKTRCICDFTHDDGYMICCDRCGEWQHVDCMGIDRLNIPDAYMCELCQPRPVDRRHARAIQLRKREELSALAASDSESSDGGRLPPGQRRKRLLTVTTYTNTSGTCVTTYNSNLPVLPPLPQPTLSLSKRGPKRHKKPEVLRKGAKRKLSEKRIKRKKEIIMNRSKYNSNLTNSTHWNESYELAMTNHYSPELRAKIMKYSSKLGNTANMASAITAHLCTTVPHAGGKILIATKDLKENTPVIELRGKYMLSNQHRPQLQSSARAGSQKPGPFVFFYRLPKDNTQICIDTKTYGNEARFVRRSCKPNAELQHCIVKGALHVYLVTVSTIPSNTEITVGHDTDGSKQPCACGNPKHCKVNGLNPFAPRKSIDYPPREKRSRNRCLSSSSPVSPPFATTPFTPVSEECPPFFPVKIEKKSPIKHDYPPISPVKNNSMAIDFEEEIKLATEIKQEIKPEIDLIAKEEMDIDEPDFSNMQPIFEEKKDQQPTIKTEIDPIIEKPKPSSDVKEINNIKVEHEVISEEENHDKEEKHDLEENNHHVEESHEKEETHDNEENYDKEEKFKAESPTEDERPITRELTAKMACHDRSSRSSRTMPCVNQDSLDDKTDDSQDKLQLSFKDKDKKKMTREERKMEAIMKAFERMEKAEQRKQEVKERQKRRESDPHPNATEKEDEDDLQCNTKRRRRRKGRARTTSQSNRRRLNSADSDMVTSGDEGPASNSHAALSPPCALAPRQNSTIQTCEDRPNDAVTEDLSLSSACLLVEAAVGSVESAFKLPKTKKTMANEWVGRSPERTPSPYQSPYRPSLVSAPSLESLVRVASTMIGDLSGGQELENDEENLVSPPRMSIRDRSRPPKKSKRITRSTETTEVTQTVAPQHSAKKRWLRQAISEESDSPMADTFVPESPPNEMITPLKKRRLARESLSCEQNNIVQCNEEVSPNLTSEDSPVKEDNSITRQYTVRNIMESIYSRDRTRSDSGQGSDDQCNMDNDVLNVNLKVPHDTENIRRIIGVPMPEDEIPKPDIISNNNNVETEESNYNKVVPMDIDTTIAQAKIQESNDNSNSEMKGIESPDKLNSCQSADTSGNSSPQRDEMDDIQKKIHSFHTENIQILKSRNKKPPKEKRKKVNLNFDLNMVDDQISIQLRTEENCQKSSEINGDIHEDMNNSLDDAKIHVSPENIPLPPVESIPLPAPENIPLPEDPVPIPIIPPPEAIPLPEEPMKPVIKPVKLTSLEKVEDKFNLIDKPSVLDNSPLPFSTRFSSSGLFSGIFNNMSQTFNLESSVSENVPNMSVIKSAIDRTTILDNSLFDKDSISPVDELKSVQEILTRVNNMDSNNSLLLSGVLKSSNKSALPLSPKPATKLYSNKNHDPRVTALPVENPKPVEKPKPVRRKLSITEYRKRLKGPVTVEDVTTTDQGESSEMPDPGPEWSSESSNTGSISPQRLDAAVAAASDELEQRLHKELAATHLPKGVFDAQPTATERQRENLSSRLRREFGLSLPDDEEARPPTDSDGGRANKRCDR